MVYQIVGRVCENERKAWAEATEKAIGGYIGFVFENRILTKPMINCRIESGCFAITTPTGQLEEMKQVFQKLSEKMP